MASVDWIATIAGAVLCLLYGWFISVVSRFDDSKFSILGAAVGFAGILVLTGMAVVGPPRDLRTEETISMGDYTAEGYPRFPKGAIRHAELLSVVSRTTREVGRRPSKNHYAFEHPDGKLEWITEKQYRKLRTDQLSKKAGE